MKCYPPDVRQQLAMIAWSYFFTTARGQTAQFDIVETHRHISPQLYSSVSNIRNTFIVWIILVL